MLCLTLLQESWLLSHLHSELKHAVTCVTVKWWTIWCCPCESILQNVQTRPYSLFMFFNNNNNSPFLKSSVIPVKHNSFSREEISAGTNLKGLPGACRRDRPSGTGRSTPRRSDWSSCRRWATSQAKAWGRTVKVCGLYETTVYTVKI